MADAKQTSQIRLAFREAIAHDYPSFCPGLEPDSAPVTPCEAGDVQRIR